jgi:hypothetical protein
MWNITIKTESRSIFKVLPFLYVLVPSKLEKFVLKVILIISHRNGIFFVPRPQKPTAWDESYPDGPPKWANYTYS